MARVSPRNKEKQQFSFKIVSFGDGEEKQESITRRPARELPFIVSNAQQRFQDANTKTYIRKHVMHDHVQRGKTDLSNSVTKKNLPRLEIQNSRKGTRGLSKGSDAHEDPKVQEIPPINTFVESQEHEFWDDFVNGELGEVEDDDILSPNPRSILGAGRVDPFGTYPIPATKLSHLLLDHFVSIVAPALIPLPFCTSDVFNPLKTIWCRYSLDDALMFQGILIVASAHLEVLTRQASTQETLFYECEIARTVNERLGTTDLALSDSTIVSVTLLAAAESLRGNTEKLLIHVSALEKLVEMRGGITTLGYNGLLQMTLSWVDLTTGAIIRSPPRWPHVKCTNTISRELFAAMRSALRVTARDPDAEVAFLARGDFPTIFQNLRMLSVMLGAAREVKRVSYSSVFYFCSMRFYLEHCLLSLPAPNPFECADGTVAELSKLASLIYLHRVLREFQPEVGALVALKNQIMSLCDQIESLDNHAQKDALLWVVSCTGTCFIGEAEKAFFAERIAFLAASLGLRTWADVELVLTKFLWIRGIYKEKCEALWRESEMYISAGPWLEMLGVDVMR